ncbi:MAG: hypothetical protein R2713_03075 [Ilumatobacteraceae bacterium]
MERCERLGAGGRHPRSTVGRDGGLLDHAGELPPLDDRQRGGARSVGARATAGVIAQIVRRIAW